MSELRKAAEKVIEKYFCSDIVSMLSEIDRLKEALSKPEDEPEVWMYKVNGAHVLYSGDEPPEDAYDKGTLTPLYTHPSNIKRLSEGEYAAIKDEVLPLSFCDIEEDNIDELIHAIMDACNIPPEVK